MDKRSCHLVRRHESECWGLFNANRTAHNQNIILLQKIAKLSRNFPNFSKWLYLYQNIAFSLEISRLKLFYLSHCILPESVEVFNILQIFLYT